jgi:hypothetical protein
MGKPKLPKILDTGDKCALCGKGKKVSTPLCEEHEEDFLLTSTKESAPLRAPILDYRIENIIRCYRNYVIRKKSEVTA